MDAASRSYNIDLAARFFSLRNDSELVEIASKNPGPGAKPAVTGTRCLQ
jgi:hypothetical protein